MKTLETLRANWLRLKTQLATPTTPASGYSIIYEEGGVLKLKTSAGVVTTLGAPITPTLNDYILVREEQVSGTQGGTATSGSWETRTINTEVSDTGGHCTLPGSNVIRLAAGTYRYNIICPAQTDGSHKARLYDVTAGAQVTNGEGQNARTTTAVLVTVSTIKGVFTIGSTNDFRIEHMVETTKTTSGFGFMSNMGIAEVYTIAEFWKVA